MTQRPGNLISGVACHKFVLSFCVGLELYQAGTPTRVYMVYMVVFALVSPLGIGIGIGITNLVTTLSPPYYLAVGILQGLAAGTILYVVVFEVLQREKSKETVPGLIQLFCVVLGFLTIMSVELLGKLLNEK